MNHPHLREKTGNVANTSKNHLTQLWPVTILSRRFGKHQQVNPQLIEYFESYRSKHPGKPGPVYASPDDFSADTNNEAILALQKFIMDNVFEVASEVNGPYWDKKQAFNVHLTGMWFQISNNYGFHETHVHGNCSWSGVYYVQTAGCSQSPEDLGENGQPNGITRFYGPHTEYQAGGHGDLGNFYLQDHTFDSYPQDGKLVVFPSHIKHMVFPYYGEADRIIVSFHAQINGDQELRYSYSST
ncbi:MAG: putative 2OG-Fe(II) oxygenase [bacterium]